MKPKYRRITKFLPAIISISMAASAQAALFFVDTAGNGTPAAVNNGTTTIVANGGAGPQDPTPTVTIDGTINMTGDAGQAGVIVVSGPNPYTINIAAGGIIAANFPGDDGIYVVAAVPAGTTINNSGLVTGVEDGIDFDGDGGTVNNLAGGVITGSQVGIVADDNLTVVNNSSITGTNSDGINADDNANITNNLGGSITGNGSDGIDIDDDGTVTNFGSITGVDDGIDIGDDGFVLNNTNFDGSGNAISGGIITGNVNGILGGNDLTVTNQNLATITGLGGDGINATNFATITNFTGGNITGSDDGIFVQDDLTLINQTGATIEGLGDAGVQADDAADITNNGTIRGADSGIFADDGLLVTNNLNGTITGTTGDGIQADDNADITNNGIISGADDGVFVDDNSSVTNNVFGVITGGNAGGNIGVRVGDNSTVINAGSIAGNVGIDAGTGTPFTLTNSGKIEGTGGVAIDGGTGVDTLNLNFGSQVIGNVELDLGVDTITFNGGLTEAGVNIFGDTASGSSSNSILGDVTGVQLINKTGTGSTAFIGVPGNGGFLVNADVITITDGGLYINANIDGALVGQTTINASGAALGGTGTWDANVFVTAGGFSSGAIPINLDLTPTNAVGGVTITGDVVHTAGSFIRFDVNPQGGGSDLITQTGVLNTYDLGGGTNFRISATDNNRVISDGVYTIVDSANGILGAVGTTSVQFNTNVNNTDTGFQGTEIFNGSSVTTTVLTNFFTGVAINGSNVELTVEHNYEGLGLDSNQASLGAALDASTNSGNFLIQDFIAALDYSDLATVQAILADFSTLDSFASASAIVSSNYQTNRVVQDHLAMTRAQTGTTSRTYVGSYAEPAPAPAPAMGNSFNVWGSVSYDWRDSSGFANDIDGEEASFLAGIDYRIAPNFLLGILLEGANADYDFSGGNSDVDTFRAAIYGTYGEATGFYADFLLGYGDHSFDSTRTGFLGGFDTDTDAESIQAMLTVGYTMESGCVKHGPFAGAEYTKVDVDGYNQGGILPILVDDYDVESTRLLIGYRAEAEYGRFTPYASVAYAHELDDNDINANGTLPGGATFGVSGGQLESAFLISIGTGYSFTESLSANAGYHGEISTDDGIDSHGATVGLNYAF